MAYKDLEKKRKWEREYYKENKEKRKQYIRKWQQEHKEQERKRKKKWLKEHPGYSKNYAKKYYREHKEEEKERKRKWREGHKEYAYEYYRKYYRECMLNGKRIPGLKKRKWTGYCEVCGRENIQLDYHHWDNNNLSKGLWVCVNPCHLLCELVDKGNLSLAQVYLKLKRCLDKEEQRERRIRKR